MAVRGSAFSGNGLQPFPVETELAGLTTDPARSSAALPLLMAYAAERQQAGRTYQAELDRNYDLQSADLQQRGVNDARQRLMDVLKLTTPGGITAAASNPLTSGLFAGSSPEALQGMEGALQAKSIGDLIQSTGQGVQGLLAGGIQAPYAEIGKLLGLPVQPGVPPIVQAAAIRAAAGGGSKVFNEGDPLGTVSQSPQPSPDNPNPPSVSFGKVPLSKMSALIDRLQGVNQGTPKANPRTGVTQLPNTDPNAIAATKNLTAVLPTLKARQPAVHADILSGMQKNGGVPIIARDASGATKVVGGSGNLY